MLLLQINTTACNGTDVFWPWFFWLLGAFLLGALLGWLIKKLLSKPETVEVKVPVKDEAEYADFIAKITSINNDLQACKREKLLLETDLQQCKNEKTNLNALLVAANAATAAVKAAHDTAPAYTPPPSSASSGFVSSSIAAVTQKDDLTKVEGIGPKIKELFYNEGIYSFKQLSETSISQMQQVLDNGGSRFQMHNPKTWAEQAKFAAEGKWDELKAWQNDLDGGL